MSMSLGASIARVEIVACVICWQRCVSRFVAFGAEARACERDGIMWVVGWEEDREVSPRELFRDLKPDEHKQRQRFC